MGNNASQFDASGNAQDDVGPTSSAPTPTPPNPSSAPTTPALSRKERMQRLRAKRTMDLSGWDKRTMAFEEEQKAIATRAKEQEVRDKAHKAELARTRGATMNMQGRVDLSALEQKNSMFAALRSPPGSRRGSRAGSRASSRPGSRRGSQVGEFLGSPAAVKGAKSAGASPATSPAPKARPPQLMSYSEPDKFFSAPRSLRQAIGLMRAGYSTSAVEPLYKEALSARAGLPQVVRAVKQQLLGSNGGCTCHRPTGCLALGVRTFLYCGGGLALLSEFDALTKNATADPGDSTVQLQLLVLSTIWRLVQVCASGSLQRCGGRITRPNRQARVVDAELSVHRKPTFILQVQNRDSLYGATLAWQVKVGYQDIRVLHRSLTQVMKSKGNLLNGMELPALPPKASTRSHNPDVLRRGIAQFNVVFNYLSKPEHAWRLMAQPAARDLIEEFCQMRAGRHCGITPALFKRCVEKLAAAYMPTRSLPEPLVDFLVKVLAGATGKDQPQQLKAQPKKKMGGLKSRIGGASQTILASMAVLSQPVLLPCVLAAIRAAPPQLYSQALNHAAGSLLLHADNAAMFLPALEDEAEAGHTDRDAECRLWRLDLVEVLRSAQLATIDPRLLTRGGDAARREADEAYKLLMVLLVTILQRHMLTCERGAGQVGSMYDVARETIVFIREESRKGGWTERSQELARALVSALCNSVKGQARNFKHDMNHPAWDNAVQLLALLGDLALFPGGPGGEGAISGDDAEAVALLLPAPSAKAMLAMITDLGLHEAPDESAMYGLDPAEATSLRSRHKAGARVHALFEAVTPLLVAAEKQIQEHKKRNQKKGKTRPIGKEHAKNIKKLAKCVARLGLGGELGGDAQLSGGVTLGRLRGHLRVWDEASGLWESRWCALGGGTLRTWVGGEKAALQGGAPSEELVLQSYAARVLSASPDPSLQLPKGELCVFLIEHSSHRGKAMMLCAPSEKEAAAWLSAVTEEAQSLALPNQHGVSRLDNDPECQCALEMAVSGAVNIQQIQEAVDMAEARGYGDEPETEAARAELVRLQKYQDSLLQARGEKKPAAQHRAGDNRWLSSGAVLDAGAAAARVTATGLEYTKRGVMAGASALANYWYGGASPNDSAAGGSKEKDGVASLSKLDEGIEKRQRKKGHRQTVTITPPPKRKGSSGKPSSGSSSSRPESASPNRRRSPMVPSGPRPTRPRGPSPNRRPTKPVPSRKGSGARTPPRRQSPPRQGSAGPQAPPSRKASGGGHKATRFHFSKASTGSGTALSKLDQAIKSKNTPVR